MDLLKKLDKLPLPEKHRKKLDMVNKLVGNKPDKHSTTDQHGHHGAGPSHGAPTGYPLAQSAYAPPPHGAPAGHAPAPGGYPPAPHGAPAGYPPAPGGYPPAPHSAPAGYPPAPGGYPPAPHGAAPGGYPPAQGGYPPAPHGAAPAGYPPAQGGYPPAHGAAPHGKPAKPLIGGVTADDVTKVMNLAGKFLGGGKKH